MSLGNELSGATSDGVDKFDFSAFEDAANNGTPIEDPPTDFDVDPILQKLLAATSRAPGTMVNLEYDEILKIIENVTVIVSNQPMLLRLKAPLTVGTDMHGQYFDLLRFMSDAGYPPDSNYLFLGDYVDRGK